VRTDRGSESGMERWAIQKKGRCNLGFMSDEVIEGCFLFNAPMSSKPTTSFTSVKASMSMAIFASLSPDLLCKRKVVNE
jgi:hypothetical protein